MAKGMLHLHSMNVVPGDLKVCRRLKREGARRYSTGQACNVLLHTTASLLQVPVVAPALCLGSVPQHRTCCSMPVHQSRGDL